MNFFKTKKYLITTLLISVGALMALSGCDDNFEQINANPNQPESVDPGLLMPSVIRGSINESVNESMEIGNVVAQHSAKVLFGAIDRYNWESFEGEWENHYNNLRNIMAMHDRAVDMGHDNYQGIALVMKSWVFSMLTNSFGDIPYSDAVNAKSGDVYSPSYDPQEQVYEGMIEDLEQANQLLDPNGRTIRNDILFDGDIMKWKRLANSLRVRLLVYASQQWDVSEDLQDIFTHPSQYPVFESVDHDASLTYLSSFPNQWPIHTWRIGTFQEYRVSKTLVDTLKAFNDPRLEAFAEPTDNSVDAGDPEYVGVPNGLEDDEAANYNGSPSDQSRLDRRYYFEPNGAKGIIMTYSELLFLKAEAAYRGWISGDPEQLYEDAVQASFDQYGVSPDTAYFEQEAITYESSRGLSQIMTQKWIALHFTGLEAWFEWRRTGLPDLEPSVRNQNSDRIPVRFMYPAEEQSLNQDNYQEAVSRQGDDNINTEMWLIK